MAVSHDPVCPTRRAPEGLEAEVLAALTAAGRPLTSALVLTQLGGQLAYTTVMTTLARLHKKGVTPGRGWAAPTPTRRWTLRR